ncbi:glycosyltransferase [Desulfomicrobium baculatum]|uniref:Glycosyl transferase family 2 n=1 Tax=Desulfomicrobium baculatum (strain DSM 4028 / VKM B-1378 / X) TaxID=525897 RepID=C7LP48_DESBD|nr:glycosyltransferase [Desulfomicrobium baculatum]ACU91364.1 glycosyl transferase family 2 [Desulfomicrobium baculatum DSM 4028]
MKFSIVTPSLNDLPRLRLCVGSVRGQTGEREHIVQDACSVDGTAQWLAAQPDINSVSEHDTGMYDAINRGWRRSQGDILSWLNSDEQYLPGTLATVASFFEAYPKVDFVYGHALVVDGDGALLAARREIRLSRTYIANSFLNAYSCTLFFRRRLLDDGVLLLDEGLRYAADMDLVLRLLADGRRYARIDKYLSMFTLDGTNLSCHQGMLDETAEVQRRHGGFRSPLLRRIVTLGRYAERFITGSYRRSTITYRRCIDEVPNYESIVGTAVSGSYRTR